MKLLLDESLPQDLRLHLSDHEVIIVPYRGWASKKNGELLQLASAEFDVLITADQNLEHQQNVSNFEIAVIILEAPSNRLDHLIPLLPRLLAILSSVRPGHLYRVLI